jgi:hypothetical protein
MGVLDPNDKILTTATARNKKVAEQEASRAALELLEPSLNEAFNAAKTPSPALKPATPPTQMVPVAAVQPVKQATAVQGNKMVRSRPRVSAATE